VQFKLWLEDEYDPFRSKVDQIALDRSSPFAPWFPASGRVYIPFVGQITHDEAYKDIADELKEFKGGSNGFPASPEGYEIADFRAGFAKPFGQSKNVYKIMKILALIQAQSELAIQNRQDVSQTKRQQELEMDRRYYTSLIQRFQNSPFRVKTAQLQVAISNNPHDIASMSTGRGWTSCMNLKSGDRASDVYCEVERGGFVAYLIRPEDQDIRSPLARIHIRRFDNRKGQSIAVPEDAIYGSPVPGFKEVVQDWVRSKQGSITPGQYLRRGGKYSDTFGDRKTLFPPDAKDHVSTVRTWIKKWLNLSAPLKKKYKKYFLAGVDAMIQNPDAYKKEIVGAVRDVIFNDDYYFAKGTGPLGDNGLIKRPAFAMAFPSYVDKHTFLSAVLSTRFSGERSELLKRFPQYIDKEFMGLVDQETRQQAAAVRTEFKEINKDDISNYVLGHLKPANFRESSWHTISDIQTTIKLLTHLSPIPEKLVRHSIEFAESMKSVLSNDSMYNNILASLVDAFSQTGTDTPRVQQFYTSLLPKWSEMGGLSRFGYAIAKLGVNGIDFVPFLRERIKLIQRSDAPNKEQIIDGYEYVIDAVQTGTGRSERHAPYWGGEPTFRAKS
jgi:hypothetical protein